MSGGPCGGQLERRDRHLQLHQYDLVFLDVRMPDLDGLEVAQLLQRFAVPPVVIFVTAYEEYAVRAFEVQASDYLLKPISGPGWRGRCAGRWFGTGPCRDRSR